MCRFAAREWATENYTYITDISEINTGIT